MVTVFAWPVCVPVFFFFFSNPALWFLQVYSKECQERQFHRSMLERLVIWNRIKKCGLVQNLSYNYRMRPEILDFVSQFYSGLQMEPMGNHMSHPDICPISFYRVDGLEQQIGTSYVNDLEVNMLINGHSRWCSIFPHPDFANSNNFPNSHGRERPLMVKVTSTQCRMSWIPIHRSRSVPSVACLFDHRTG